ncbi:MAG: rod shape-determining protein MreD [Myxococcota bacterium]|nr:rod shape-determining protein MreD [Myxococcota bacterium]
MSVRVRLLGLGLALLLMQQLLASLLPHAFRPDLLLVYALALGLRSRAIESLLIAFAFGYAVDVLSGAPIGLYALLRATACLVTHVADRGLNLRGPGPWVGYVAAYAVVDTLLLGQILHLAQPGLLLPWSEVAIRLPGTVILTAAVAAPLYRLFMRLDGDEDAPGLPPASLGGSRAP